MTIYHSSIKSKAIELRKSGSSLAEIAIALHISKSTASLWLHSITLDETAKAKIEDRKLKFRLKGLRTINNHQKQKYLKINNLAKFSVSSLNLDNQSLNKVLCSLLYWGEGSKRSHCVAFINSDPAMISVFLTLLRNAFQIDEKKLRALVHIHEYHSDIETKQYWSKLTSIPLSQFTKSYLKPHTQKIKRPGYKGAIRIAYYDSAIVNELKATYNELANHLGM